VSQRLTTEINEKLIARKFWQQPLDQFARATHLAVALVNLRGGVIGEPFNPQPLWSLLVSKIHARNHCPFSLSLDHACTCVEKAHDHQTPELVKDYAGLVHFTVPLKLGEHRLAAIMAGQVFDKYPQTLPLERLAAKLQLPRGRVWELAQTAAPVRRLTLRAYADLLTSLCNAWLNAGFNDLLNADRLARTKGQMKRSQQALAATQEQLHMLAGNLLVEQDEQRKRMAFDLHDDFGQRLAALAMSAHLALNATPSEAKMVSEQLQQIKSIADLLSDDMRRMAHTLHPTMLEHLGLPAALRSLAENFTKTYSMKVTCTMRKLPTSVPSEISVCLFRVAQEALQNVVKHARNANTALVVLGSRSALRMIISDKGQGFDTAVLYDGLGLISMQERVRRVGGKLRVSSTPGSGTEIDVAVPLVTVDHTWETEELSGSVRHER
jgi:signal transduction histidine kinase